MARVTSDDGVNGVCSDTILLVHLLYSSTEFNV
jgi:hypothetical protein